MFSLLLFFTLSAAHRLWTTSDSEPEDSYPERKRRSFQKHNSTPPSCSFSHLQYSLLIFLNFSKCLIYKKRGSIFFRNVFYLHVYSLTKLSCLDVTRWSPCFCFLLYNTKSISKINIKSNSSIVNTNWSCTILLKKLIHDKNWNSTP